jgi:hypothetical protein
MYLLYSLQTNKTTNSLDSSEKWFWVENWTKPNNFVDKQENSRVPILQNQYWLDHWGYRFKLIISKLSQTLINIQIDFIVKPLQLHLECQLKDFHN